MEPIKAFTLKRDLVAEYDEEYLEMKVSDLRNKLEALARANYGSQLEIKEIQNSLNPIKAGDIRTKRSIYQLAYRRYILICPDDELLSVILELKSRLDHLDRNGDEIWSPRKLEAIEHSIRAHDGNGHLRVEVEALAKAIDEGRFRHAAGRRLAARFPRLCVPVKSDSVCRIALRAWPVCNSED